MANRYEHLQLVDTSSAWPPEQGPPTGSAWQDLIEQHYGAHASTPPGADPDGWEQACDFSTDTRLSHAQGSQGVNEEPLRGGPTGNHRTAVIDISLLVSRHRNPED